MVNKSSPNNINYQRKKIVMTIKLTILIFVWMKKFYLIELSNLINNYIIRDNKLKRKIKNSQINSKIKINLFIRILLSILKIILIKVIKL